MGHATFQVQKQVEQMLTCFEHKIVKKVDAIGASSNNVYSAQRKNPFHTNHEGRLFYWSGAYRRVPEKWIFPNKMTLRAAWHRYFFPDHESCICPLRYLTSTDMASQKNGRINLSNLKSLMNYMIGKLKDCNKYIENQMKKKSILCIKKDLAIY